MIQKNETVTADRKEAMAADKKEAMAGQPKVVAVCGVKNSGKTTFLEKLVREFTNRGVKTAVIKHDGHDFSCDIAGTDSFRMKEAGAYGTAVFSENRIFVHKTGTGEREKELISLFPEADLIFLEGMKDSEYPKIEVIRRETSESPVSNPTGRFLIVTDLERERFCEPCVGFEQIEEVIRIITERIITERIITERSKTERNITERSKTERNITEERQ